MVRLPGAALAQLAELSESLVDRGDVFWLPADIVVYRGEPKERPCLVAAIDAARAHMVAGTAQSATGPPVVAQTTEVRVRRRTEFDFSLSFPLTFADLIKYGEPAGRLAPERLAHIDAAIAASNLVALKRLMRS